MEEVKLLVKSNDLIRKEVVDKFKLLDSSNLVTTKQIAKDAIAKDIQKTHVLNICADVMEDMQEDINPKDNLICRYEEVIGDDKINNEIRKKVNSEKSIVLKINTRKQIGDRLMKRTNQYIKSYNKK